MPIPESQLAVWSKQGATTTAASTRNSIYTALYNLLPRLKSGDAEVYLQGSYGGDTNIRGDSDVDIVVRLNATFRHDLRQLSEYERGVFEAAHSPVTYDWRDFRRHVLGALRSQYGEKSVAEGNKCIDVAGSGTDRLPADVVVALQYRKYSMYLGSNKQCQRYVPGIVFFNLADGREIINYPMPHLENGVKKITQTNGRFKPVVRVLKDMRNRMIENGYLQSDVAPSYFLQCLIYNVPNEHFAKGYQQSVANIINWGNSLSRARAGYLVCQNEQLPLFGNTPEQWGLGGAWDFMSAARSFWNEWQ